MNTRRTGSGFSALPEDILGQIFKFFVVQDILNIGLVDYVLSQGKGQSIFWENYTARYGSNIKTTKDYIVSKLKGSAQFILDACEFNPNRPFNVVICGEESTIANLNSHLGLSQHSSSKKPDDVSITKDEKDNTIKVTTPLYSMKIFIRNSEEAKKMIAYPSNDYLIFMSLVSPEVYNDFRASIPENNISIPKQDLRKKIIMFGIFASTISDSTKKRINPSSSSPLLNFYSNNTTGFFSTVFFQGLKDIAATHNQDKERDKKITHLQQ